VAIFRQLQGEVRTDAPASNHDNVHVATLPVSPCRSLTREIPIL